MTTDQSDQIEDWIAEVGLDWLSQDERNHLAGMLYDRLEERVGTRLSSGMTDDQLDEFGMLTEGDDQELAGWLETEAPDFLEDLVFIRLREAAPEAPTSVLLREYASMRWLQQNAPDYADVVKVARDEVKEELRALAAHLATRRP